MLVIRLTRVGKKNQPSFRVILTEKANPVRGKFIEILGHYNPRSKEKSLNVERIKHWLSKGAQPSATVHNLLVSEKIIDTKKVKAWRPKKKAEATAKPAEGEVKVKPAEIEEIKQEDKSVRADQQAESVVTPTEKQTE